VTWRAAETERGADRHARCKTSGTHTRRTPMTEPLAAIASSIARASELEKISRQPFLGPPREVSR